MYREPIVMRRKLELKSMVWTRRKKETSNQKRMKKQEFKKIRRGCPAGCWWSQELSPLYLPLSMLFDCPCCFSDLGDLEQVSPLLRAFHRTGAGLLHVPEKLAPAAPCSWML